MMSVILIMSVLLAHPAYAVSSCNNAELRKIDRRLDGAVTVTTLYKTFRKIQRCKAMDGDIAEGFDDQANKLLANLSNDVLSSRFLNDRKFRRALLNSVSDGTEIGVFEHIRGNAQACAKRVMFCRELKMACDKALRTARKIRNHKNINAGGK